MLIAGSINPNAPPNLPPEWTSQPSPSFTALTAGTYDFSANTTDPDGDTLTYTLNASSSALPTGITLGTDGILTADGTQTSGDTTGLIVDVNDGVNSSVSSSAFTITVAVTSETSWPGQDSVSYLPAVRNRNGIGEGTSAGRGFGMDTRHAYADFNVSAQTGTEPSILHVTNLNSTGAGSLFEHLCNTDVPRIIVFDIGGTITLDRRWDVKGKVWLAGQTAPGPVLIYNTTGSQFLTRAADCFFQHISIWSQYPRGPEGDSEDTCDAVGLPINTDFSGVVWDHCFVGGGTDECFSMDRDIHNVTMIDSLFAYPRGGTSGDKYYRKFMSLIAGDSSSEDADFVSWIGCCLAHGAERNPKVLNPTGTIANMIVYNRRDAAVETHGKTSQTEVYKHNFVGIWDKGGPDSFGSQKTFKMGRPDSSRKYGPGSLIYIDDTRSVDYVSDEWDVVSDLGTDQEGTVRTDTLISDAWPDGLVAAPCREGITEANYLTLMTQNCGPFPNNRDSYVQAIFDTIINGTGSIEEDYTPPSYPTTSTVIYSEPSGPHEESGTDPGRTKIEADLLSKSEELYN